MSTGKDNKSVVAGLSPVLYHITGVTAAASIFKNNSFDLKPSDGNKSEEKFGLNFYLSTARNPNSGYLRRSLTSFSVLLVLDGRKMGQRYKGAPVDYWQSNHFDNPDYDEQEDRVFSPKPFIRPAIPYIKSVHAVVNSKTHALYQIWRTCVLNKIPIYFYEDSSKLLSMSPRARVEYKPAPSETPSTMSEYDYKYRTPRNSTLRGWLNLWLIPLKGRSPQQAAKAGGEYVERAYQRLRYSDASRGLAADMHNAKSTPLGAISKDREALNDLVKIMRDQKVDVKGFCELLRDKWYPKSVEGTIMSNIIQRITARLKASHSLRAGEGPAEAQEMG